MNGNAHVGTGRADCPFSAIKAWMEDYVWDRWGWGFQRFSHAFSFANLEAFQLEKIQTGCTLFKSHNKPEREDVVLFPDYNVGPWKRM